MNLSKFRLGIFAVIALLLGVVFLLMGDLDGKLVGLAFFSSFFTLLGIAVAIKNPPAS